MSSSLVRIVTVGDIIPYVHDRLDPEIRELVLSARKTLEGLTFKVIDASPKIVRIELADHKLVIALENKSVDLVVLDFFNHEIEWVYEI